MNTQATETALFARSKGGGPSNSRKILHWVPDSDYPSWEKALCGAYPGSGGAGWNSPCEGEVVNCPKCAKKYASLNDFEARYYITPKVFLAMMSGVYFDNIDASWKQLKSFVAEEAKRNGYPEGIPCLVFDEGGECITLRKEELTDE